MTRDAPPEPRRVQLYQVDAFTDRSFTGNPAGVVPDASGLTDREMQDIASELGNPETAFVFPSAAPDAELGVRFFSPTREVPLCGHATLAVHYVRATREDVDRTNGPIRQRSPGGVWTIDVERDGDDVRVWSTQEPVRFGGVLDPGPRDRLLEALGVDPSELHAHCPVRIVSTGHAKVMVGLASRVVLDSLAPDRDALEEASNEMGEDGIFVFALDSDEPGVLTECRMFAPALGIDEDPVTGSGQGPLGAYLVRHGLLPVEEGRARFRSIQGKALGRPGVAEVLVEVEKGEPVRVRVGGRGVVVFSGELEL